MELICLFNIYLRKKILIILFDFRFWFIFNIKILVFKINLIE